MLSNIKEDIRYIEKTIHNLRSIVSLGSYFEFGENPEIIDEVLEQIYRIEDILLGKLRFFFTQEEISPADSNNYYKALHKLQILKKFVLGVKSENYGSEVFTEKFLEILSEFFVNVKNLLAYFEMVIFPYENVLNFIEQEFVKLSKYHPGYQKFREIKSKLIDVWQQGDQNILKSSERELLMQLEELTLNIFGKTLNQLEMEVYLSDDSNILSLPLQHSTAINKYWAIIIGVSQYEDVDNFGYLPHASKDARELARILLSSPKYDADRLRLCVNDKKKSKTPFGIQIIEPKWSQIEIAIQQFAGMVSKNDLLFFYFSGHGELFENEPYLIACDTYVRRVRGTGISMRMIKDSISSSKAQAKIIVLDTCHSGAIFRGKKSSLKYQEDYINHVLDRAEGLFLLTSCGSREKSFPHHESGLSVFTHFLIEGLEKGKKESQRHVVLSNLNRYIQLKVKEWSLKNFKPQTPRLQMEDTYGDPIIIDWRELKEGPK